MEEKKLYFIWDHLQVIDNNWDNLTNAVLTEIFGEGILKPVEENS